MVRASLGQLFPIHIDTMDVTLDSIECDRDLYGEDSNCSSGDGSEKDKKPMTKEIQQLAFINPGRLTAAGFNPEFSNREKRKLSRLMDQQNGRSEAGKGALRTKPRRQALHDNSGLLMSDGRDLCDCQDPECPGCHYPCPQCQSAKCGSLCRCNRRWSYDHVYVYNEGIVTR